MVSPTPSPKRAKTCEEGITFEIKASPNSTFVFGPDQPCIDSITSSNAGPRAKLDVDTRHIHFTEQRREVKRTYCVNFPKLQAGASLSLDISHSSDSILPSLRVVDERGRDLIVIIGELISCSESSSVHPNLYSVKVISCQGHPR